MSRTALLLALEEELPRGTIRYSSKIVSIEEDGNAKILHLSDGSTLRAKVKTHGVRAVSVDRSVAEEEMVAMDAGADRVRRDQLGGGEMAGARKAVGLGAHGHARTRQVPGRPWLRAQVSAVGRPGIPCRHGALQRHRRLLVLHVVSFPRWSVT